MSDARTIAMRRPMIWTRPSRDTRAAAPASNASRVFAHVAFFTCLILQRFGLPFAGGSITLSLPIFAGLVVWLIASGRARVPALNALMFVLFAGWAAISTLIALSIFDPNSGVSTLSLIELLIIYTLLLFRPAGDFDVTQVQRIFLIYARVIAICGIIQFVLQFGGVRLFAFSTMFPPLKPVLIESGFNMDPIVSYGAVMRRSNGFFLLEPSVMSQMLVLALYIDYFVLGRKTYLPLYAVAYMCTFSGSGLLTLVLTLLLIAPLSFRNMSRGAVVVVTGAAAALLFALILPAQFATFAGRFNELSSTQTSGHARYIAQFSQIQQVASDGRALVGFGPGATQRSIYYTPGSGNPALQLFVDYGFIGLSLFFLYFIKAVWRRDQPGLTIMFLIIFELGGGNLLFAPVLLLIASLTIWSEAPRPSMTWRAPSARWRRPAPAAQ